MNNTPDNKPHPSVNVTYGKFNNSADSQHLPATATSEKPPSSQPRRRVLILAAKVKQWRRLTVFVFLVLVQ